MNKEIKKELEDLLIFFNRFPDKWINFIYVGILFFILVSLFSAHNNLIDSCNQLIQRKVEQGFLLK